MFKRCFACLLPSSCTRDAEASQSVACGFYTGLVYEVGEEILVLELDAQQNKAAQVLYIVPRNDRSGVKPGHAVYFLKESDRELLTIPALLPFDECLCTISTLATSYLVLLDSAFEPLVFPYPNTLAQPQRFHLKHALLVRAADGVLFDIVVEGFQRAAKKTASTKLDNSDSTALMTDDSALPTRPRSPDKKYTLTDEDPVKDENSYKHSFSFSNPFTIKEEEHQSSSVITLEGDSGGEGLDIRPLALPDLGLAYGEDISKKRLSSLKLSSRLLMRTHISPYPPEETRGSLIAQPEKIGRDRLPLHLLKQPSISDKQIEILSGKAAAWRCAGPGASSFFWCMAVSWLEHLARVTTALSDVDLLVSNVMRPTVTSFEIRPGFEQHCEAALKILQDLRNWKDQNRTTAIVRLQNVFQQREMLMNLERYLRMICVNYLEKLAITPELSHIVTENLSQQASSLSSDGSDFSSLTYMAMSDSLNLSLCLLRAEEDNSISVEEYRTEDASGRLSEVMMLQQDMHFHLLYSREDLAVDGYDMDSHCYEVLQDASRE